MTYASAAAAVFTFGAALLILSSTRSKSGFLDRSSGDQPESRHEERRRLAEAPRPSIFGYQIESSGTTCARITSSSECSTAAASLGLSDNVKDDRQMSSWFDPPYCYLEFGKLKFNANGGNTGSCKNTHQCLCKVKNRPLSGTATQSSTYLLVGMDGGFGESNPWWQLDVGQSTAIGSIRLLNRPGICASRLFTGAGCGWEFSEGTFDGASQGADIYVGDVSCSGDMCYGHKCDKLTLPKVAAILLAGQSQHWYEINCNGLSGRYVSLMLPGNDRKLNFMEIQIYEHQTTDDTNTMTSTTTIWDILEGEGSCSVTDNGACIQTRDFGTGDGHYKDHDACKFTLQSLSSIVVEAFETESGYDMLTVGTQLFSGSGPTKPTISAPPNTVMEWRADSSVTRKGWKLCAASTTTTSTTTTSTNATTSTTTAVQ